LTAIRVWAGVTLIAVAAYLLLRVLAARCSGAACDAYIPVSLLLPLAALVLSAVTGLVAVAASRDGWRVAFAAATVFSALGPVAALLVLRDQPDAFVPVATLLVVLAPIIALVYTALARNG
jgi:hypothetical protein